MPVCVLVLNERTAADRLRLALQEAGTPLLRVALVAPASEQRFIPQKDETSLEPDLPAEALDDVELLNPGLARRRRQKSMARWLMPFGFFAGSTFTQITTLETFASFGPWGAAFIGGLLGMGSGLMGSYAAAASVPSENEDGVRILRNRHLEGCWLLLLETRPGMELPWQTVQKARPQQVVRLSEL
ncbi:MAG: hypothetical protein CMK50_05910 [Propionibacteriaceae bacterium]|nr:hypothetical protein [Propionibacteriaceae bacterium]